MSQFKTPKKLEDVVLDVSDTDRIHYAKQKKSLTFSFKSRIQTSSKMFSTIKNLGSKLEKLKISTRELEINSKDLEMLRLKSLNVPNLRYMKFRSKLLKQLNTQQYLDLFRNYVSSSALCMVIFDLN
jgi:hypothetical protein